MRFTTRARNFLGILILNSLIFGSSAWALTTPTAPPTDSDGPYKTNTGEYRFQPTVDTDVLDGQATEVWARVFWPDPIANPTATSQKRPLLVFLHGNHGTCGRGTAPRNDSSCQYTNEGICPNGYLVTPNHEGYNYVAKRLASWGYVVVSVNANRGITCGGGNSEDWGLVLARGRLVLKHLQLWNQWSTLGGAPKSLGSDKQFVDQIDMTNVGLMGHSRGGEGVRAALNLYRDPGSRWVSKIPNLDIRAIYEIGAVDGQSDRVLDAPSVAWNQILPLCDGDVSDLQGRMPFERMMARFSEKNEVEARPMPKSLSMVWGANHNYFNTEWQTSDSYSCAGSPTHKAIFDTSKSESIEQQSIASQSMTAFFRAHVGAERVPELARHFDPSYQLPAGFVQFNPIDRDYISGFELNKFFRVDDFTGSTGLNPSGAKNIASQTKVEHVSSEPPVANIEWKNPSENAFFQTNFADSGKGTDISSFAFLDFRVGRQLDDAETNLRTSVNFSVQLVASDDSLSAPVEIADYTALFGPPHDYTNLTQTVRIPLSAFPVKSAGTPAPFDLRQVRGVRFVFNKSAKSGIRLAHVRFGAEDSQFASLQNNTHRELLRMREDVRRITGSGTEIAMDEMPALTTPLDQIVAEAPSTSHRLLAARDERRASWMKPRKIKQSRQLRGASAIEIVVATEESFPVMNSLPVLKIGDRVFAVSRYPASGDTHTLIFSIAQTDFDSLPASASAAVQYGLRAPSRIWSLPQFIKADVSADLGD